MIGEPTLVYLDDRRLAVEDHELVVRRRLFTIAEELFDDHPRLDLRIDPFLPRLREVRGQPATNGGPDRLPVDGLALAEDDRHVAAVRSLDHAIGRQIVE